MPIEKCRSRAVERPPPQTPCDGAKSEDRGVASIVVRTLVHKLLAPATGPNFPAGQGAQAAEDVAPVVFPTRPATHFAHEPPLEID